MENYFEVRALSASLAKQILKSPAHAKAALDRKFDPTPAQQFGTIVHGLILEPHRQDLYIVKPDGLDRRSKDGRAAYAELEATGLPIISRDDEVRALKCRDAVFENELAREYLDQCTAREQELFWSGYYGVPHKAKIDASRPGLIVDIKTTADASPKAFSRSAINYGYHLQAANYKTAHAKEYGIEPQFVFIAVETVEPFGVAVYEFDDRALIEGDRAMRRAARIYKICDDANDWPKYEPVLNVIEFPSWTQVDFEDGIKSA